MRTLLGAGTPRAAAEIRLFWLLAGDRIVLALLASPMSRSTTAGSATPAFAIITVTPDNRVYQRAASTATACLRASGRDVEAAVSRLEAAAQSSGSTENAAAYSLFLATAATERRAILNAVALVDGEPTIEDLDGELHDAVFYAAEREHLGALLQRLEGWWLRRAIRQLAAGNIDGSILSEEIESEMSDFREQFKLDALQSKKTY